MDKARPIIFKNRSDRVLRQRCYHPTIVGVQARQLSVKASLTRMTAVATGAAIFAESREWTGDSSTQKLVNNENQSTGKLSLWL